MTDITPGPWNVRPEREYDRKMSRLIGANIGPDGESIRHDGEVRNGGVWVAEAKGPDADANARLIAAAPELLEALKDLLSIIRSVCPEYEEATMCANARAAIAKAQNQ